MSKKNNGNNEEYNKTQKDDIPVSNGAPPEKQEELFETTEYEFVKDGADAAPVDPDGLRTGKQHRSCTGGEPQC